ncbi:hypothetical protein ACLKA7_001114 [Drosophila subpalustris]
MSIKLKVLSIFLIFIHSCKAYNSDCFSKKEVDSQCAAYCYEVVKPLLQYAGEAQRKEKTFTSLMEENNNLKINQVELEKTIDGQENELKLYKSNNATQRIQEVTIHEIRNFPVFCDSELVDSGWTVIQRRQDASVSFERNWSDYRKGFGDMQGSFFIGLEKLYLITNERPHELYVHLKSFENETRFARYDHFQIGDESESYKLKSIGKYSGDAGDSFSNFHNNMKFSTFDQDNDESTFNCAAEWLSGWWFKNCAYSNLNGLYRDDVLNLQNGIKWNSWHEIKRFIFVQMMIRPIVP